MYVSVVILVRLFLTALALVLSVMALSAWRRRRLAPEAPVFAILILSAAIYCFGYAGEVAQTTLAGAQFWLHVEYFGVPWIPALWLLGARNQSGLHSRYSLLFAIPVLTFVSELSNSLHGLYDRSMHLAPRYPFWIVAAERGSIAWLSIAYLNFALIYGAWIYLSRSSAQGHSRTQTWVMVCSSLFPLGGYLIYLFGWSPWGLDLGPILLGATVVLGYIAVFRFGCFDLVPTAHTLVFSSMRDAVLVADLQYRLVDFNPAARELLPCLAVANPGDDLQHVLREIPALAKAVLGPSGTQRLGLNNGGENKHFDVRVSPLCRNTRQLGLAVILADITAQVRLVHELRQEAGTDALTGVANRRSFLTAIERQGARSARYGEPYSVALVDLDEFKAINDQFGHPAGDSVLLTVADRIHECLRTADMLSRYGGDEFVVLLPQTDAGGAWEVGERIRRNVTDKPFAASGKPFPISISVGLATYDTTENATWEELLKHADEALYDAKAGGRNKVAAWKSFAYQDLARRDAG